MRAIKISKGLYEYKGYRISNCGCHEPGHCIWWKAVDMKTGCADYHATTKKFLMEQIDDDLKNRSEQNHVSFKKVNYGKIIRICKRKNCIRSVQWM